MNKNNMLTRFDEGKSHEQNALGGVPIGNNNSVEQGETKNGNFIYSNRIFLDDNVVSQYNLPKSLVGKSVADATKFIDNKFKGRNDKISQSTKDSMLSKIAEAQEAMKPQEPEMEQEGYSETPNGTNQLAWGGDPTIDTSDSQIEDESLDMEGVDKYQPYVQGYNAMAPAIGNAINSAGNDQKRTSTLQSINTLGNGVGSAIGGVAGGYVGNGITAATGLYDMGTEAFGKSNVETSGQRSVSGANAGKSAGSGALKGAGTGASIGSMIMPGLGTAIGAVGGAIVGGVSGLIGGKKDEKAQAKNNARYASNFNKQFSDQYAFGGEIDPTQSKQMSARDIESAKQMSNYRTLRDSAISRYPTSEYTPDLRTPEQAMMDYQYLRDSVKPNFKVNSGYMPNLTSPEEAQRLYNKSRGVKLAMGGKMNQMSDGGVPKPKWINEGVYNMGNTYNGEGTLDNQDLTNNLVKQFSMSKGVAPGQYIPSTTSSTNSYLDKAKTMGKNIVNYAGENYGNALRYVPIAANAYQLAKLKKPQAERLERLGNRYKPSYVDMAQQQNIVNQELNNTNSAIQESGASQGAARNAILGAQLNKTKALSNAYMNAEAQNRQQDAIAQQFNLGVDQTNLQQSNTEKDINARDQAAYRNAKREYITGIGEGIGNVGNEQAYKKIAITTTGYNWLAEYQKANPTATPEQAAEAAKKAGIIADDSKTAKKNALGGYLIKNRVK